MFHTENSTPQINDIVWHVNYDTKEIKKCVLVALNQNNEFENIVLDGYVDLNDTIIRAPINTILFSSYEAALTALQLDTTEVN